MCRLTIPFLIVLLFMLTSYRQESKPVKKDLNKRIDGYIRKTMQVHGIPGVAIAVIKQGKVIHKGYYGSATPEEEVPVGVNSLFRVYSTTKLITTVGVFQLIEKGKLSLEDKISKYLDSLPVEWQEIKIKNLLTHSSGLPDLVRYESTLSDEELLSGLYTDQMDFETGSAFRYNQTNYWLLTLITEKITGLPFEDYILKNQFSSNKSGVLFSSNSTESVPDRVDKFYFDHNSKKYEKATNNDGIRAHSGNGLNITLERLIQWNKDLDDNSLLSAETKSLMWEPFEFKNGKDTFLYGWGQYPAGTEESYGFTGGGVSGFRKFTNNDVTIILLTNGFRYFPVHNTIINHLAGLADSDLTDPKTLSEEKIISAFLQEDIEKAERNYLAEKKENPEISYENVLNSLAYALLRNDRIKNAIRTFKLNVRENPGSWNVYDSLAEGYFLDEQYELSLQNYKKSLKLNPENRNATEMIKKIEDKMKKNK